MTRPLASLIRFLALPMMGLSLLLTACGGSSPVQAAPIAFPNTLNLPTLNINSRVVNLNGKGGYQYVKVSLTVIFADPKAQFTKANGDALTKLQAAFAADHESVMNAFNDVVTTDLSTKTADDLQSPSGKEALRRQLIQDFNARLSEPPQVLWVEFTDFVMQ